VPTSLAGTTAAFLRRTSLLAALLAIVAGLLGMHVLAGSHGVHGTAVAAPASNSEVGEARTTAAATAHSDHTAPGGHVSHASAPGAEDTAAQPPSCSCQGSCGEVSAAHASCVPAPGGASLTAPPPGTVPVAVPDLNASRLQAVAAYAYLPGSPSPGDLSISRT
jgi:hypothetical protein